MPVVKDKPSLKEGRSKRKPIDDLGPHADLQYHVNKELKADKKVRPAKVFQNYKPPTKLPNRKKNK